MKRFILLLACFALVFGPLSAAAAAEPYVKVFLDPETRFLRVETKLAISGAGSDLELRLFPNAQVTALWTPGMSSYGVERSPSATTITVRRREGNDEDLPLELSYEGMIAPEYIRAGHLDQESLWFPLISVPYRLTEVAVEVPLGAGFVMDEPWQMTQHPLAKIYSRAVIPGDYPDLVFFAPAAAADDPQPDTGLAADDGQEIPEEPDEEKTLHLAAAVPLPELASDLLALWQDQAPAPQWMDYFAPAAPGRTESLEQYWTKLLPQVRWVGERWQFTEIAADRQRSHLNIQIDGTQSTVALEWHLKAGRWQVHNLSVEPAAPLDTALMTDSVRQWVEDLFVRGPAAEAGLGQWFYHSDDAEAAAAFLGSLAAEPELTIYRVEYEMTEIFAEVLVASGGHKFMLELLLRPHNQRWLSHRAGIRFLH